MGHGKDNNIEGRRCFEEDERVEKLTKKNHHSTLMMIKKDNFYLRYCLNKLL
jgi:hypothetical protein